MSGFIRTVHGDLDPATVAPGVIYSHEHLIIDSLLIEKNFEHIHLYDVQAAVDEVLACRQAGASLMVDTMPASSGRDAARLAQISEMSGVPVVAATGLHHDRYYGHQHWSNRVSEETLVDLFVADLLEGIDQYDYTSPIISRLPHRAGLVKVATSGTTLDSRDRRNLRVAAETSTRTGAPVLTHCEGGVGGLEQVEFLLSGGVPSTSIILSHVDKAEDLGYLVALAQTGVVLELDQILRQADRGLESVSMRAIIHLVNSGFAQQIVVGTDGARRSLWASLGGSPGLAWLALSLPRLLSEAGLEKVSAAAILGGNAARALTWR
jgi:predicted metal-dependent phosphotriesterase family hydrolase